MRFKLTFICLTIFIYLFSVYAPAAETNAAANRRGEKKTGQGAAKPNTGMVSITDHAIKIAGKTFKYRAIAGDMIMTDESGKQNASIFFIAYTKTGGLNEPNRPVTFAFNGGPGSSAVWVHMGALGPKRVPMADDTKPLPALDTYVDNEHTWLEFTDLVLIDPVGTGYSRLAPGVKRQEFHGVAEDIKSVGDFIRLYITKNERWLAPVFLAGESYGTTRAAGLSGYLLERYGMYVKGLVLMSSALDFQTHDFVPGNDLPYALFLPTYTATAWYHKTLPPDLQAKDLKTLMDEIEEWALTEYMAALIKGDRLSGSEREGIVKKLSRCTGLSETFIRRANLRIVIFDFIFELLREENLIVGRLDSRYKNYLPANQFSLLFLAENHNVLYDDPGFNKIYGAYAAAFNHYVRNDLQYKKDLPYELFSFNVYPWNYGQADKGYVNTAVTLSRTMARNNDLKVLVASGYYDLATPHLSSRYTFEHLGLHPDLRKNIVLTYYEAGHMMYIHKPSLIKLRDDVRRFYAGSMK